MKRTPRTAHRAPLATFLCLFSMSCDVTAPDRSDVYNFRLQPENLAFVWPDDRLPVRYFAQSIGALPDYVRDGIGMWESQFLYGEFEGELTTDSAHADVWVTLEGGSPPAAPLTSDPPVNVCVGSTSATLAGTSRLAGPMLIRVRWFPGFSATDVANCLSRVTAHEIGHTLGLFEHSSRATDLMFGVPAVRTPSARDRSSAEILYHTKPDLLPAARL